MRIETGLTDCYIVLGPIATPTRRQWRTVTGGLLLADSCFRAPVYSCTLLVPVSARTQNAQKSLRGYQ